MNPPRNADDLLVDASQAAQQATLASQKVQARARQRQGAAPPLPPPPDGAQTGPVTPGAAAGTSGVTSATTAASEPEKPAEPDPPKEFDPRWREPFVGLVYLGRLVEEFELFGHRFRITTPSHLEKMDLGLVHKPYLNTVSSELVLATILVAAYLQDVDGRPLPQPIVTDTKDTALHERFRWVSENLSQPVINRIYNRCLALDEQVEAVLDAMGEARG